MKDLDVKKTGLSLGLFLGSLHLVWSVLIFLGVAQWLLDFVFWMHMIVPPYRVSEFSWSQTLILVLTTFVIGYMSGLMFAWIWNRMQSR